ncbi:hypothetical protein PLESTF_001774700 [Pleodorina starrii]|nr:hypothetical protein PLESTM_001853500 [Pleodorina starrii]GLC76383.1 hypothetical protein PLESTF_001774700 [Pleodorina starrii]
MPLAIPLQPASNCRFYVDSGSAASQGRARTRRAPIIMARRNETDEERAARKAATKAAKAEKRAERQGLGDPAKGRKPCSLCGRPRDLLIRCQVDATLSWQMACGKCWLEASGGEVDGAVQKPYYRYGGLWKNHHKAVSGRNKVPAAAKAGTGAGSGGGKKGGGGPLAELRNDEAGGPEGEGSEAGSEGSEDGGVGSGDVGASARGSGAAAGGAAGAGAAAGASSATRALLLAEAARCEAEDAEPAGQLAG